MSATNHSKPTPLAHHGAFRNDSVDGGAMQRPKPSAPAPRRSTVARSRRMGGKTTPQPKPKPWTSPSARLIDGPANEDSQPNDPAPDLSSTAGDGSEECQKACPLAPLPGAFDELRLLAETFWDNQKNRVATGNRLKSGEVRVEIVEAAMGHLDTVETLLGLAMRRCMRRAAPWAAAWAKDTHGIGEHTLARLLGSIGHPVVAYPMRWVSGPAPEGHVCTDKRCGKKGGKEDGEERHLVAYPPFLRTVGQLWAYCGHGDPTRKRRKGATQDEAMASGSPDAKTLVHLMAECCMKAGGPYREVYDLAKIQYADRVEASGKHEGKPWSDGHKHNAALRKVGKEILRDLWIVAQQAMHEEAAEGQGMGETHCRPALAVSSPKTKKRAGGQTPREAHFPSATGSAPTSRPMDGVLTTAI